MMTYVEYSDRFIQPDLIRGGYPDGVFKAATGRPFWSPTLEICQKIKKKQNFKASNGRPFWSPTLEIVPNFENVVKF